MIRFIQKSFLVRIIWLITILQIVNLSVNTPDAQPYYLAEDLSINDIESAVEWVLEDFLDIDNAITEQDEPGSEEGDTLSKKIFFFHTYFCSPINTYFVQVSKTNFCLFDPFYLPKYLDILSPPPQA